jgi:hypothetical protein
MRGTTWPRSRSGTAAIASSSTTGGSSGPSQVRRHPQLVHTRARPPGRRLRQPRRERVPPGPAARRRPPRHRLPPPGPRERADRQGSRRRIPLPRRRPGPGGVREMSVLAGGLMARSLIVNRVVHFALSLFSASAAVPPGAEPTGPVDVYLIGGQSNATGQKSLKNRPKDFAPDNLAQLASVSSTRRGTKAPPPVGRGLKQTILPPNSRGAPSPAPGTARP